MVKGKKKSIQAIQKEQVQLVRIEKVLESLLSDIKESINEMKVEELQLKSSLVEHFTDPQNREDERPTTSAQAAGATDMLVSTGSSLMWLNEWQPVIEEQQPTIALPDENVNKQLLDLDTFLTPMQKFIYSDDEEEEEQEEEDDDEEEDDSDMDRELKYDGEAHIEFGEEKYEEFLLEV